MYLFKCQFTISRVRYNQIKLLCKYSCCWFIQSKYIFYSCVTFLHRAGSSRFKIENWIILNYLYFIIWNVFEKYYQHLPAIKCDWANLICIEHAKFTYQMFTYIRSQFLQWTRSFNFVITLLNNTFFPKITFLSWINESNSHL